MAPDPKRPLVTGDRVCRLGYPLEIGNVILGMKWTVKVMWPGGSVEEIDRNALVREGGRHRTNDDFERDHYAGQVARNPAHLEAVGSSPEVIPLRHMRPLSEASPDPPAIVEAVHDRLVTEGLIPPDKPERL